MTHYRVVERIQSPWGKFSLLELKIDTGRTHQIRVHLASLGHPVVGDALYGAPRAIRPAGTGVGPQKGSLSLTRNFLHAAALEFAHPRSGEGLAFSRALPRELQDFLERLREASDYNGKSR